MPKCLATWFGCFLLIAMGPRAIAEVLFIADEFPAMEVLAKRLKAEDGKSAKLVAQSDLPKPLASFEAVVVYIHGKLAEAVEHACIDYANAGGRLVLLHHSISSGKRQNRDWFAFLGVELPQGDAASGGYKWIEDVTVDWVNLATNHYMMTNRVTYSISTPYADRPRDEAALRPAITLSGTEVYLNHVLKGPRTPLMGLKYKSQSGSTWIQDTAGWLRPARKGWVVYLMPGHTPRDFEDPAYGRIVLNAITAPVSAMR